MTYRFQLTPEVVRHLQAIERVRERVRLTVLPPAVAESLRTQAALRSTHYSTRIEGNRLTLKETEAVVKEGRAFPGRERDVLEVKRYYEALQRVESWAEGGAPVTEAGIRRLHATLYAGRRARPTPYRDGQNVIRDPDGTLVYLPPESKDVPGLMTELVGWINASQASLPIPVIAGIAHYQFETIHPFYDGNGRTGRMLTTWILYRNGYELGRFYALEEFYAEDLPGYYSALVTHLHHNYYFGRHQADLTPWLNYFLRGMALVFDRIAATIEKGAAPALEDEGLALLRPLDPRARQVLGLFVTRETITSADAARLLGLSQRQTRDLLAGWVEAGWLVAADPSKRGRKYRLAQAYRGLVE